ncbi:MAG: hypothetical protein V4751_05770 [Pseudomonadota bacterium]
MVRLFLYTLLAIVTGLVVTLLLASDPGYLLISFRHYTFETSLFALFVALLVLVLLLRLLFIILDWINPLHLLNFGRSWSLQRRLRQEAEAAAPANLAERQLIIELQELQSVPAAEAIKLEELRKFWKKRAKNFVDDIDVLTTYLDVLEHIGAGAEAVAVIESSLERQWNDLLVRRYALLSLGLDTQGAAKQLQRAETWLQTKPQDAVLLLTVGRLSLRNQLWGKARDYFERSLKLVPDTEVFAELARLLQNLHEPERNAHYLRPHTGTVGTGLPKFPQP